MKRGIFLSAMLFIIVYTTIAQNNTNTEFDSKIAYKKVTDEPISGTFTDTRDGNTYNWVKIGEQFWMAENLKYLPEMAEYSIDSLEKPYYFVYDYHGTDVTEAKATENYQTYGVLYNWYAASANNESNRANSRGIQGVCPAGWQLPSEDDWQQLIDYLGGPDIAGGKLKETGTTHWESPNYGATNETGFTALPGGHFLLDNVFVVMGRNGVWWSSTEEEYTGDVWFYFTHFESSRLDRYSNYKQMGYSVRCVRDSIITGISEQTLQTNDATLNIYPNPVHDILNIDLTAFNSEATISIYTLEGKLLLEQKNNGANVKLDLSKLPQGIYLCRYTSKQTVKIAKVVKQ